MSHMIELPDDAYQMIEAYAARQGQTPEAVIRAWAAALRDQVAETPPDTDTSGFIYDPADDPLAEFLGIGELTMPEAIRRHDEAFAEEERDASES